MLRDLLEVFSLAIRVEQVEHFLGAEYFLLLMEHFKVLLIDNAEYFLDLYTTSIFSETFVSVTYLVILERNMRLNDGDRVWNTNKLGLHISWQCPINI